MKRGRDFSQEQYYHAQLPPQQRPHYQLPFHPQYQLTAPSTQVITEGPFTDRMAMYGHGNVLASGYGPGNIRPRGISANPSAAIYEPANLHSCFSTNHSVAMYERGNALASRYVPGNVHSEGLSSLQSAPMYGPGNFVESGYGPGNMRPRGLSAEHSALASGYACANVHSEGLSANHSVAMFGSGNVFASRDRRSNVHSEGIPASHMPMCGHSNVLASVYEPNNFHPEGLSTSHSVAKYRRGYFLESRNGPCNFLESMNRHGNILESGNGSGTVHSEGLSTNHSYGEPIFGENGIVLEEVPVNSSKQAVQERCSSPLRNHEFQRYLGSIILSPQKGLATCINKKLLVLDLNGLLADVTFDASDTQNIEKRISGKAVFKRPFCDDFLNFCFERFHVGVWSSRRRNNVNGLVDYLMPDSKHKLLFCWDQSKCTYTGCKTVENMHKPLVLKELRRLWDKEELDLPWELGEFSLSNTLLIDDSPYKALCNPPYTAIFPQSYHYYDKDDSSLGPGGDLRVYLEGLVKAYDVQRYVRENPFGQRAITPSNPSWNFYLQIIERLQAPYRASYSLA